MARGGALSDTLGRSLCKCRPRLFPLDTAPVIHFVVAPAASALRLLPRGRAPTGEVGAPTRHAPGRVSAVSLRVSEALATGPLEPRTTPPTLVTNQVLLRSCCLYVLCSVAAPLLNHCIQMVHLCLCVLLAAMTHVTNTGIQSTSDCDIHCRKEQSATITVVSTAKHINNFYYIYRV